MCEMHGTRVVIYFYFHSDFHIISAVFHTGSRIIIWRITNYHHRFITATSLRNCTGWKS